MQIIVAKHAGFCEGVRRAYLIATDQAKTGRPVFMLGNLVHNSLVVADLVHSGIKIIKSLDEISAGTLGTLLISAHGVAPEVYEQAKKSGLEIVDTTCPWVKKAQNIAKKLADEGCAVIIVGDSGHAEVRGLVGWSGGKGKIVQGIEDIERLDLSHNICFGIIAQTTQAEEHFNLLADALQKRTKNVKIVNTICKATQKRQQDAVDIAKKVDLMLVVGDQMSANTKRLAELCSATKTETCRIETAEQLDKKQLAGRKKIGVTAGASTPEWIIKDVIKRLRQF